MNKNILFNLKKDTQNKIAVLEEEDIAAFRQWRKEIEELKQYFNTQKGAKKGEYVKPYKDFIEDVKFERGQITKKNYYANLGNVKASYRTYLR